MPRAKRHFLVTHFRCQLACSCPLSKRHKIENIVEKFSVIEIKVDRFGSLKGDNAFVHCLCESGLTDYE